MKNIRAVLRAHQVAQMPPEVRKLKNSILRISIVSTLIMDAMSLALKGSNLALSYDFKYVAFFLLVFYLLRDVVRSSVQTYSDTQKNLFDSQSDSYIIKNISHISNTVRGKVYRENNDFSQVMSTSEVILALKEFIGYIWNFERSYPTAITNTITALILSFTIIATEFIQTGDKVLTMIFSITLVVCIIIFIFLYKKRIDVRKLFRENHRLLRKQNDILYNDVKNIEPLVDEEFEFRVDLLDDCMKEKRQVEKTEIHKLDVLQIMRSCVLALFLIVIICIKIYSVGGIDGLTIILFTDVIAISTVFSNILDKVGSILNNLENLTATIQDAERVKVDVDNIMDVYYNETAIDVVSTPVTKVEVQPFEFSYPGNTSVYSLKNTKAFELQAGKSYGVFGHTGCGKTTTTHLFIGKIRLPSSPFTYNDDENTRVYLSSIMHECNGRLGTNPVLQELIFNKDTENFDKERMVKVLRGTYIYSDIMRNIGLEEPDDEAVFNYLRKTTIDQYSSGQKQRLAIVKLLYNLNPNQQLVVFDEATNSLDDETALSVLSFMANFCQEDTKRIVLFISHQVELTKKVTTGGFITFVSKKFPIFEIVANINHDMK